MSDSDENLQITRNNPLTIEASANEQVTTSNSSTNAVAGIHKRIRTTTDESQHSSNTENLNRNSSGTSTTPRNTFGGPGSSNLAATSSILITEYNAEPEDAARPTEEETSLPNQSQANVPNIIVEPQQSSRISLTEVPCPIVSHQTPTYPWESSFPSARSNYVPLIYQRVPACNRIRRYFRALMGCRDESESFTSPILPSFEEATSDNAVRIPPLSTTSLTHLGPPSFIWAPPSYLAVVWPGLPDPYTPNETPLRIQPSPPFIAPIPPPTYAQAQGLHIDAPVIISAEQIAFGPSPLSVICSRCAHVIVTSTQSHRSNLMHLSALILCLLGCWPCCLVPYCMDSCKIIEHHCPRCHQMLGTFSPL